MLLQKKKVFEIHLSFEQFFSYFHFSFVKFANTCYEFKYKEIVREKYHILKLSIIVIKRKKGYYLKYEEKKIKKKNKF